jgi:hypothetical protein
MVANVATHSRTLLTNPSFRNRFRRAPDRTSARHSPYDERMTSPARAFAAPSSKRTTYFNASRAHRYSVLFALPLLIGYEALASLLAEPGHAMRNGADALFRAAFTAVAGPRGNAIFMAAVILLGVGLVVRDRRANRDALRPMFFAGMLAESAALAAVFGVVIGLATAQLLGSLHVLMIAEPPLTQMSWPTRLMLSLGAGLYEELFFRVFLVTGLAVGTRVLLGFSRKAAGITAAVVGAVVFSAFHYIGPYGDPLQLQSFVFRMLSGLAFSGLYLLRGFGITAWTHALYDAFLLLA